MQLEDKKRWWVPTYRGPGGSRGYSVPNSISKECPVSVLLSEPARESQELVRVYNHASWSVKATGSNPLGPSHKWPARIVDAFNALEAEKCKEDNARQEWQVQEAKSRQNTAPQNPATFGRKR